MQTTASAILEYPPTCLILECPPTCLILECPPTCLILECPPTCLMFGTKLVVFSLFCCSVTSRFLPSQVRPVLFYVLYDLCPRFFLPKSVLFSSTFFTICVLVSSFPSPSCSLLRSLRSVSSFLPSQVRPVLFYVLYDLCPRFFLPKSVLFSSTFFTICVLVSCSFFSLPSTGILHLILPSSSSFRADLSKPHVVHLSLLSYFIVTSFVLSSRSPFQRKW